METKKLKALFRPQVINVSDYFNERTLLRFAWLPVYFGLFDYEGVMVEGVGKSVWFKWYISEQWYEAHTLYNDGWITSKQYRYEQQKVNVPGGPEDKL